MTRRRVFTKRQRKILQISAGNRCQICKKELTKSFHADHKVPFSKGGLTLLHNGQALCAACNLSKGSKMQTTKLRPWQQEAIAKCLDWYSHSPENRHFVINAAPGAGKTICASKIAAALISDNQIERVIVIAPRTEVVRQWSEEFYAVTGRNMTRITGSDINVQSYGEDLCATWSAVESLSEAFQLVCRAAKTLVICDEHHHAAVSAAWGDSADSAFNDAKYALILTGTPIRSDGEETVWMACDSQGQIKYPVDGIYTLTYGQAVDLDYCRPTTFHRHEGNFSVKLDDNTSIEVSGIAEADIPANIKNIKGLSSALDFYRLVCTPKYLADGVTPDTNSYHGSMVQWGISKLDETRHMMPEAGGLVIAPNIEMAEYFCGLLERLDGERPVLVHSKLQNSDEKIASFRRSNKRWIVSVAMVSEGVDIKRLRVLLYLPHAQTELSFRQAIGRVVRTTGKDDRSRAYVVMPTHKIFEAFAKRVEGEMSPKAKKIERPKNKKCPVCENICDLNASECDECGHEFSPRTAASTKCWKCGTFNPIGAESCHSCGASFTHDFQITLNEALRMGAIVRGMSLDEEEVQHGERISKSLEADILSSGDAILISMWSRLPDEAASRLVKITSKYS